MGRAKKKLLPKNFQELLESGDLAALKAVFDTCDLNARGGYSKETALAYAQCPDDLAIWLVENGADLEATDLRGETPLHSRARSWRHTVDILLDLGANVNSDTAKIGTPLHAAADSHKDRNARSLLARGALADALNREGWTPLELALRGCSNSNLEAMYSLARMLLDAGARKTERMAGFIERIGKDFEFHRSGFNPETVEAASAALDGLYGMFGIAPVPRRAVHDGAASIIVKAKTWPEQHQELWELLVPSSGPAATVQGELIRISGRITAELEGNGGANWDDDYRTMAATFLRHIQQANALSASDLALATTTVSELKRDSGDARRLCELAVRWALLNPSPIKLPAPTYRR